MANSTTYLSLIKPEKTDTDKIRENFNTNMDTIDGRFSSTYLAVQAKASVTITGGTIAGVTITGGSITGMTDLAIADGGTGSSTAANARTALGVAIGSNVQAYDAGLLSIAALTTAADKMIYTTGSDTYATATLTTFARTILDDDDASTVRGTLGIDLSLYYLQSAINTQAKMETIWGVTLLNDITGESIGDLSDVDLTDIANEKMLQYNSSSGKWECETAGAGAGDVSATGTPVDNDYAKFTDGTTIEGRSYAEVKTDLNLIKCKDNATAAPTTGDDSDDGYAVNSIWGDVTNDKSYICLDATVDSAVWIEITQSGGGDVIISGTPSDSQIAVWTNATTIEGAASLTYDGSNLQLTGDIGSTGTPITKGWFTDFEVTNAIAGSITGNAATLTISDNESTNESNAILFTSGGVESGNLNIESDGGNLSYNPSTGTLYTTTLTTSAIYSGYISMQGELDMTGANTIIDLNPAQVGTVQIINITPTAVLTTNEAEWDGISINGNTLQPSGSDILVHGVHLDFGTFSPTGTGVHVDGFKAVMPDINEHGLCIVNGKIIIQGDVPSTAIAQFTGIDFIYDIHNMVSTSILHAIDVAVAEGAPDGDIVAVGTHTYIDVIHQHIGTFESPEQASPLSFAGIDDAGDYTAGLDGVEMFEKDGDGFWIGDADKFDELEVDMSTDAARDVVPTFWYWHDGTPDAWVQFYPADDTDGFQHSGLIRWMASDLTDWLSADVADTEGDTGYWIRVLRTAVADPGTPTATTIKTGAVTLYSWDKTGDLTVKDINAASLTLDTVLAGSIGFTQELDVGEKTANFSVDFATDQKQKCTLTANTITLTLDTTSVAVGNYILKIVNGGLATLTWASESGSIYFPSGTDPSLTSSGTDILAFYFDGTNWYGLASLDFS